jgi:hypothetical protein
MDENIPAVAVGHPDGRPGPDGRADIRPATDARDLVVLSHLRWVWVWQRPQHLISRLARSRRSAGARTWFVEEPVVADVAEARVRTDDRGDVIRVWLEIPREAGRGTEPGAIHAERDRRDFNAPGTEAYGPLLAALLAERQPVDVWVYTPMAFDIANALERRLLVYDVMDDLASFADAPEGLRLRQRRVLAEADLVLAGGRSLRRSVLPHRPDTHLFASGVDTTHYAASAACASRGTGASRATSAWSTSAST